MAFSEQASQVVQVRGVSCDRIRVGRSHQRVQVGYEKNSGGRNLVLAESTWRAEVEVFSIQQDLVFVLCLGFCFLSPESASNCLSAVWTVPASSLRGGGLSGQSSVQ